MKNLDIKNKGEDAFGEKIMGDEENPKMRYSIQDAKNPFDPKHPNEELDNRRVESMPDMKLKDYKDLPNNPIPSTNRKLFDLAESDLDKNEKDEDKDKIEESKEMTPSELQRNLENMQTDDKPSHDEIEVQQGNAYDVDMLVLTRFKPSEGIFNLCKYR